MPNTTWTLLTAVSQGAIAIIQIAGNVDQALHSLTGRSSWKKCELHLVKIPNIDEAIIVKINDTLAHVMPHGGLQVVRNFANHFAELKIKQTDAPQFPEAEDSIETAMLATLAIAESPLAINLLLGQPAKLRGVVPSESDLARSRTLNHLITPPTVVLLGEPNTGKSTLMNALTKQDTSIVHELPGATRDAVGARVLCAGLVIDLYDLPGFRNSKDAIEQEAILIAKKIASQSVLTMLIADAEHTWLHTSNHAIRIATKCDLSPRADAELCVSAVTGEGLESLSIAIRNAIIPPEVIRHDGPWFFTGLPN